MIIRALILLVCSLAPAWAQAQIVTLDTTDLDLSERAAGKTTVEFTIPAKLLTPGVRLVRWNITQGGKLVNAANSRIDFPGPDATKPVVLAGFDLMHLGAAGSYLATLEFTAPPAPSSETANPPPGTTRPAPREQSQTVQLKLTRPAAELRVAAPLKIEQVHTFPAQFALAPGRFTLAESAGKSWARIDPSPWNVELRRGDAPVEAYKLRVWLPSSVNGWGQADATVELDGPISLGTSSGTLTVRAPQLAAGTVDFAVTVVSRMHVLWLLLPIALGITGGLVLRNRLEARRTRLEALIPAKQELETLAALIDKAKDDAFERRLQTAHGELQRVMRARRSTPQVITEATKAAAAEREKIVKEMTDLTNKLRADIDAWHRCAAVKDPLPENVRPALTELREKVEEAAARLEVGELNAAHEIVKHDLAEPVRALRDAIGDWLDSLAALKTVPAWQDTKLATELTTINGSVDRIRQALTPAETADPLWKVLLDVADVLGRLKVRLFGYVGGDQVRNGAATISKALLARDRKLKPQADAIDNAILRLPAPATAETVLGADTLVDALQDVRNAVVEGLKSAWGDDPKPLPGLAEGRFLEALKELEKKPLKAAEGTLNDTESPQRRGAVTADDVRRSFEGVAEPAARTTAVPWTVMLDAREAVVSQPVMVRVLVIVPEGGTPPELSLSWYLGGEFVGVTAPGTLGRPFIFDTPGTAVVEVRATDAAGTHYTARRTVTVLRPDDTLTVEALEEQLARAERAQNLISTVLVAVIGWLIFSPSFIGTFPEFVAAFLWGFSADVGAAKVRELTESMKGLKATLPLPKPG
jgi:hypothetical protein